MVAEPAQGTHVPVATVPVLKRCPRQDSNLRFRLRRAALYPLSYGGGSALSRAR